MCADGGSACKHDCLQAVPLHFLFSASLALHQLTNRCSDSSRMNPSLLAALICVCVWEMWLFCLFMLFLNGSLLAVICPPQTHYTEGDYITQQGATGDTFYLISKGQVKLYAFCSPCTWNKAFQKLYICLAEVKMSAQLQKLLYDGNNWLCRFSALLFTIRRPFPWLLLLIW